jgi:triacylglycerol lipase
MGKLIALLAVVLTSAGLAGCSSEQPQDDSQDGDLNLFGGPLGPAPKYTHTRYPMVLVSGFATSPSLNNFRGLPEKYQSYGQSYYVADLPPYDSADVRGAALAKQIEDILARSGAPKVNILAHSMGGLDARVAISSHGLGGRVASLTTISSPHQGSALGDLGARLFRNGNHEALNAFAAFIGAHFSDVANDSHLFEAFVALSTANARAFNDSHPDDPRVYYQSWAGIAGVGGIVNPADDAACEGKRYGGKRVSGTIHGFMVPMAAVLGVIPQDAMVTVESAKHGAFQGCVPGDHLDEVGDATQNGPIGRTHFDRVRFYVNVTDDLATRGL